MTAVFRLGGQRFNRLQVEGLSVCWPEVYAIRDTVQKDSFEKLAFFRVIRRKVQKMRLVCEF